MDKSYLRRQTYNATRKHSIDGASGFNISHVLWFDSLKSMMIGKALGYNTEQLMYLVSTDIFMQGWRHFLQLNKYFGIGLQSYIRGSLPPAAPLTIIGQNHGGAFGRSSCPGLSFLSLAFSLETVKNFPSHRYRLCGLRQSVYRSFRFAIEIWVKCSRSYSW